MIIIHDKILRLIWTVLFAVMFIGVVVSNKDQLLAVCFGGVSGIIFFIDFRKFSRYYKEAGRAISIKKRWHIFLNFTQWLFWTSILYIPFTSKYSLGYKIFVIADLFVISTFAFYKFTKSK